MTTHARSRRPGKALLAVFAATAALAGGAQALAPSPAAAATDEGNGCLEQEVFYFVDCEEDGNGGGTGGGPTTEPGAVTVPGQQPSYGGGGVGSGTPTAGPYDLDADLAKDNAADNAAFRRQETKQAWEDEWKQADWEDYKLEEEVHFLVGQCGFAKTVAVLSRMDGKTEDEMLDEVERRMAAAQTWDLTTDCAGGMGDELRRQLKSARWRILRNRRPHRYPASSH